MLGTLMQPYQNLKAMFKRRWNFTLMKPCMSCNLASVAKIGLGPNGWDSWLSIWLHLELTKPQAVEYTCEGFFFLSTKSLQVGRPTFNANLLRWDNLSLIWATPTADSLYKGHGRKKPALYLLGFTHSPWQVHSLMGIRHYFFWIVVYPEDRLSFLASWTEWLLDSWTFC